MKIELGLKSGTLAELEYLIEYLAENFYTLELEYNCKEDLKTIYNLYAEKSIVDCSKLNTELNIISKLLDNEKEKGDVVLHASIYEENKELYSYHYYNI